MVPVNRQRCVGVEELDHARRLILVEKGFLGRDKHTQTLTAAHTHTRTQATVQKLQDSLHCGTCRLMLSAMNVKPKEKGGRAVSNLAGDRMRALRARYIATCFYE